MASQEPLRTLPARRTHWAWTVGTFFGAGLMRPGPGTYGSVAAALLWYAAAYWFHPSRWELIAGTIVAAALTVWVGIRASTIVANESGRKDPGHVVIDEVAGQLIALIAMPPDWRFVLLAVVLFRVFDILKPPPIRQLERLPDGTGIMLDDVAAGLLALAFGQVLLRVVEFFV